MATKQNIKDYPVIEVNIDDLKEDKSNPNSMTLEQERGLEKSIISFGRLKHIVVDQDLNVIDGAHRLTVEKANGTQKVNVIQVTVKDEIERKMMRETLNKLHGTYNKEKESSELLAIFENHRLDELAELLAQPKEELENLISRYNPDIHFEREEDESKLPSLYDTESFVKKGEIWQLGRHRLMCGDNQTDLKDFIKDIKVAQLNTDPPYAVDYASKNEFLNKFDKGNRIQTGYVNDEKDLDHRSMFNTIFRSIQFEDYNTIYIWSGGVKLHEIRMALEDSDITWGFYLVWVKNNHVLGQRDYQPKHEFCIYGWKGKHKFYSGFRTSVLEYDKPHSSRLHPTMKPIELISQTIKDGTQPNDIVLDVFGGSGSTLIACEQFQRRCYIMEIDEHYCSVIIKRWELYTNQKARKVN